MSIPNPSGIGFNPNRDAAGKFAPDSHADSGLELEVPAAPQPRVPTDREMLDSIALMMAETQDWDADLTDAIASEIARSGRPHPGDILTAEELDLIEDTGVGVEQAAGQKYQDLLHQQRTKAATAPLRADPTDTVALLKAHAARVEEASRAMELTAAKAIAQTVQARWPDAAYLRFEGQYLDGDEDDYIPKAVLDKDFNVIAAGPYLTRAGTDPTSELDALATCLSGNGRWDDYQATGPDGARGRAPMLMIDEAANIDLDEMGAGGPHAHTVPQ